MPGSQGKYKFLALVTASPKQDARASPIDVSRPPHFTTHAEVLRSISFEPRVMRSLRSTRAVSCVRIMQSGAQYGLRSPHNVRQLHTTPCYRTDGVYQDLTNMRVRTPWIEALRRKRQEEVDPTKKSSTPVTPSDRDLGPKKMSDSFHRVVHATVTTPLPYGRLMQV